MSRLDVYESWGTLVGGKDNVLAILSGGSGNWPQGREAFRLIKTRDDKSTILVTDGLSSETAADDPFGSVPKHAGFGMELWLESTDDFDRSPCFMLLLYLSNLCASGRLTRSAVDEFGGISVEVPVDYLGVSGLSSDLITPENTVGVLVGIDPSDDRTISMDVNGYSVKLLCCRVVNAKQLNVARNGGRKQLVAELEQETNGWFSTFGEISDAGIIGDAEIAEANSFVSPFSNFPQQESQQGERRGYASKCVCS